MRALILAIISAVSLLTPFGAEEADAESGRCAGERSDRYRARRLADLGGDVQTVEFFPRQGRMGVQTRNGGVTLWDAVTGSRVAEIHPAGLGGELFLIDQSPDGDVMVWMASDGLAVMYDTRSGAVISRPPALRGAPPRGSHQAFEVPQTLFSAEGSRLGVRTVGNSLVVLDGRTGEQLGEQIPGVTTDRLQFSTDSLRLVAQAEEPFGGAGLNARNGRPLHAPLKAWSDDVQINSEGTRALIIDDIGWTLVDPANGGTLARGEGSDVDEEDASFVDGGRFVLAESDREARLMDARAGVVLMHLGELAYTNGWVDAFGLQFAPDHRSAVSRAPDGSARLWDLRRGRLFAELGAFTTAATHNMTVDEREMLHPAGPPQPTGEFRYSADGARLITRAKDGRLTVWNARTGRIVRNIAQLGSEDGRWVSPDGRLVLTVPHRGAAALWESRTGRRIAELGVFAPLYTRVDISPDGRAFLISDIESTELWDIEQRRRVLRQTGHIESEGAAFSDDGGLLAIKLDRDGEFEIWDARAGVRTASLGPAWWTRFFRIGRADLVLAVSSDALAFWDPRRGERVLHCSPGGLNLTTDDVSVVRNGLSFIARASNAHSELWRIEPR